MKNISFALTTMQFKNRTKVVTRRLGWKNLKPGELLHGVVKSQGLKKGQHPEKLGVIRVVSVRREKLNSMRTNLPPYGQIECMREGFSNMSPMQFIQMFCEHNDCTPDDFVTRIEFQYVE